MPSSLFDRIKNTVESLRPKLTKPPAAQAPPETPFFVPEPTPSTPEEQADLRRRMGYASRANITHIIRDAGRKRHLLYMQYNGTWRHVEPYSFRQGKNGVLFYGFCLIHNETHSFLIHNIQEVVETDIPYAAR